MSNISRVEQRTQTDCLRCCLAMMTGLPYEDLPDFVAEYDTKWPSACEQWLSKRDMGLLMFGATPRYVPPWLPIMAKGPTERANHHHCIVVMPDGVIDPHPSQAGLKNVIETYAVVKRSNTQINRRADSRDDARRENEPKNDD